jgi:hypothetical protein
MAWQLTAPSVDMRCLSHAGTRYVRARQMVGNLASARGNPLATAGFDARRPRRCAMPRGDKSKCTDKQEQIARVILALAANDASVSSRVIAN